jgi:formate transporter
MCNALVCLAVWMCYSARTPSTGFSRSFRRSRPSSRPDFEHCIVNVYFIPMGLFIKAGAPESFCASIGKTAADFPELTWGNFVVGNLLPVTIGNMIGGSIMVAAVYWSVYLRKQ